ncbi:serine hydrolase [Latilactobacillus sakei]
MKRKKINIALTICVLVLGVSLTFYFRRQFGRQGQALANTQMQLKLTKKQLDIQRAKVNKNDIDDRVVNELTTPEQAYLKQELLDNNFSGTILIVRHNHVIYQGGRGYANSEQFTTPKTTYQIGSVQKSLTAALVMKAVENGQLKLTDHLSRFYPQIPKANQITLQMMLDMRSGLFETSAPKVVQTDAQRLQFAIKHLRVKKIGQHAYSPVNYVLLAGLLEQATHKSYNDLMKQQIITPLGVQAFNFMPNFSDPQHATAYAYQKNGAYGAEIEDPAYIYTRELGTGNLYATASDLYQVEEAIVQGKVFKSKYLQQLRHTNNGQYSGGVYNYRDYFTSHGIEAGFESHVQMSQNGESGIILLSNQYKSTPSLVTMSKQIYQQLLV